MKWDESTALVTGASSGIGAAFATALAGRGTRVILAARREDRLRELAGRLPSAALPHEVIAADLAAPDGVARLLAELDQRGLTVDVLVNNAGFATHGAFVEGDPGRLHDEVALNVSAVVDLTAALLPPMVRRGRGAVINVASTAAFQSLPYMAVYGATKAFVLSLTDALWGELEGSNVRVLALCPGATQTEFFEIAGESASVGRRQAPGQVVATALRALDQGRPSVVPGTANTVSTLLPRLAPRRVVIRAARRLLAPQK